jgi:dipeptidyl aminopeptidase/acylaminoacyl peptidase
MRAFLVILVTLSAAAQNAPVRKITYDSSGLKIHGYMAVPPGEGKVPCVIVNRGGNDSLSVWDDDRAARALGKIASWGYVVVASQYRGAAGSEGKDEFGGADVDDVLNLIPVLEAQPRCDAARLGMIGISRGGMMTYLTLTRTDRIAAAIVNSGLADPVASITERPEMENVYRRTMPGYEKDKTVALAKRAAVRFADKLHKSTPILLLHGTADWRTRPATNALAMASALLAAKHPFRLILYEGGAHGLTEHREDVDRATRDWLDRYVRDRKPWPSLEPHGN